MIYRMLRPPKGHTWLAVPSPRRSPRWLRLAVAFAGIMILAGCGQAAGATPHPGATHRPAAVKPLGPVQACRYLSHHGISRKALLHVHRHHTGSQTGRTIGTSTGLAASRDHDRAAAGRILVNGVCSLLGVNLSGVSPQ